MKLKLEELFVGLITEKPFYGRLVSGLQRIARPGLKTMAVGIRSRRLTFFYDPAFLDTLSYRSALFILEHELLHLVLDHIPRNLEVLARCTSDLERRKAAHVANIAMDAAVNPLLRSNVGFAETEAATVAMMRAARAERGDLSEDRRDGMVLPEKYDLPEDGTYELYQWMLASRLKDQDVGDGPSHAIWIDDDLQGDGDGEGEGTGSPSTNGQGKGNIPSLARVSSDMLMTEAAALRDEIKEHLRKVVRALGSSGRGTLPGNLSEWLETYLADPIIPWWTIFATRARMSRVAKSHRSVQVQNRTLLALSEEDASIIPAPGRVRDQAWRVFLYVDTSGSMSSESLQIVKSELEHMLAVDEGMEIRYMQGDTTTQLDVVLKTGDKIPGQMEGRGGTDFDAYFLHMQQYVGVDEKTPDIVIVYTDGYAPGVQPDSRLPPEIPVVWLVTPSHSAHLENEGYGEVIVCDPAHNKRYG